ncbi:MAG: hypothetical protein N4A47_04040 [Clostridia bacterium]|jgi:hypothetical protein|nr:hypothetical protein [Clostridia bacterium]
MDIKSFASNANALIHIKDKGLLLKHSGDAWNMLMPIYATTIEKYNFISKRKEELLSEYEEVALSFSLTTEAKKDKLIAELAGRYGIREIEVLANVSTERRIKYSKTANEYRLYMMDFYIIKHISTMDQGIIESENIHFIPLEESILENVISSGMYKGYKIVNNVIDLLKDKSILEKIRRNYI